MTYTVLVKLEDSIVILGIKAETEEVARELALEYFTHMGYNGIQIASCEEGLISIEEIKQMRDVLDCIPPSRFSSDLRALRMLAKEHGSMPDAETDLKEAKKVNKERDTVEESLPPWDLTEDDKCLLRKYGIAFA
jgi:hypothetical protein